jgi:hypothetical protein
MFLCNRNIKKSVVRSPQPLNLLKKKPTQDEKQIANFEHRIARAKKELDDKSNNDSTLKRFSDFFSKAPLLSSPGVTQNSATSVGLVK